MSGFVYKGKLSEEYWKRTFAVCVVCEFAWEDDNVSSGPIRCPDCSCCLQRGLTEDQLKPLLNYDGKLSLQFIDSQHQDQD